MLRKRRSLVQIRETMGLILYIIIGLIIIVGPFILDAKIARMSNDSKFKKWWRNNVIGEYEE